MNPSQLRCVLGVILLMQFFSSIADSRIEILLKSEKKFDLQVFFIDQNVNSWSEQYSHHITVYPSKILKKYIVRLPNATALKNIRFDLGAKPDNHISIGSILLIEKTDTISWNSEQIFNDFYVSKFLTIIGLNDSTIDFTTISPAERFDPYLHLQPENITDIMPNSNSTEIQLEKG